MSFMCYTYSSQLGKKKENEKSISYLSEMMMKYIFQQNLLKKQVETRTADGRRRITPLCIAQLDTGYVW